MYTGKKISFIYSTYPPMDAFRPCIQRYRGIHKVKSFPASTNISYMAFIWQKFTRYRGMLRPNIIIYIAWAFGAMSPVINQPMPTRCEIAHLPGLCSAINLRSSITIYIVEGFGGELGPNRPRYYRAIHFRQDNFPVLQDFPPGEDKAARNKFQVITLILPFLSRYAALTGSNDSTLPWDLSASRRSCSVISALARPS